MTVTPTPEVPELGDPADRRLALGASGLLRTFNEAGVLEAADVHVANRVAALSSAAGQPPDQTVTLAMALTVRAIRNGSVCLDLAAVEGDSGSPELPWPRFGEWVAALRASPLLAVPPVLRLYGDRLLYLDRYWLEEEQVCAELLGRLGADPPVDAAAMAAGLDRVFHRPGSHEQRAAAEIALSQLIDRAHRWAGHRQDHHRCRLAGAARRAGRARRAPAPADRAGRADRQGGGPAAGGGAARDRQAAESDRARLTGLQADHAAPAAGRTPRHLVAVPASSRKSVAARRDRRRRDVDGVADHDGPAARSGAPGCPADPGRRPRPAGSVEAGAVLADLVDGISARGDMRVADAEDLAPIRRIDRHARRRHPGR